MWECYAVKCYAMSQPLQRLIRRPIFLPETIFLIQFDFKCRIIEYPTVSHLHPWHSLLCFPAARDKVSNVAGVSGQAAAQEQRTAH